MIAPASQRLCQTPQPHLGQPPIVALISSSQRLEIGLAKLRPGRNDLHGRKAEHVEQGYEEHAPDTPVEIPKWMDGLKSTVRDGQQFRDDADVWCAGLNMTQPFGEIIAKQAHLNRHFIKRRRMVHSNLHIPIPKSACPIWEERAG
ncbi:MAG: hypothetical protein OJF47_003625 [Nitrospira sp.]|nr:MAG: hypothetical protein OJF47_003625 [Nitrospira sp.]